jgi:hypothetical protein
MVILLNTVKTVEKIFQKQPNIIGIQPITGMHLVNCLIGFRLEHRIGVGIDVSEPVHDYQLSADQRNLSAQFELTIPVKCHDIGNVQLIKEVLFRKWSRCETKL